jgi:hypothetical protein
VALSEAGRGSGANLARDFAFERLRGWLETGHRLTANRLKMAQDDKKDYQLLATEESAPPPAYEAESSSSTSDVPDTRNALLRAQPVRSRPSELSVSCHLPRAPLQTAVPRMTVGGARNAK